MRSNPVRTTAAILQYFQFKLKMIYLQKLTFLVFLNRNLENLTPYCSVFNYVDGESADKSHRQVTVYHTLKHMD